MMLEKRDLCPREICRKEPARRASNLESMVIALSRPRDFSPKTSSKAVDNLNKYSDENRELLGSVMSVKLRDIPNEIDTTRLIEIKTEHEGKPLVAYLYLFTWLQRYCMRLYDDQYGRKRN